MRGFGGYRRQGWSARGRDAPPPVEISFTPGITPEMVRARALAKGLVLDLSRAADEGEREVVLGELFVEVVPNPVLAGQLIIDLAGAVVHVAEIAAQLEGHLGQEEVRRILESTFGEPEEQRPRGP